MIKDYDIIVVGGGHAGCEAAYASATMGMDVLLITMDMGKIAQMSCNPAIGGIAKGQIVKEVDALGGMSGLVTDATTIQFRMLNRSKGPAMWSPRAQCDRMRYSEKWRGILENTSKLDIWQDSVSKILIENSKITGVHTELGQKFNSKAVIITAGTFLNGKIFIGKSVAEGGRIGELSSKGLTEQIRSFGIETGRMKTGTPPRIDFRSVNKDKLIIQEGDKDPQKFSFLNIPSYIQKEGKQNNCYIVYTNEQVHEILKSGFDQSPLFSGLITGIGPRYCPSIEDKLRTFAGKEQHQLFLEPEGLTTNEYYLQGFSSSLPYDIQIRALQKIEGFENLVVYRPAYAIEYDYFPPTQLHQTLESKIVPDLYFAGQVNGTTGYEEAAAQGLMAGINASLKIKGEESLVLKRDQAYIGVLIDDLVTKGVDEPYRMFTSRAEYRILLRQDNADHRLTSIGYNIGLVSKERFEYTEEKYKLINELISEIRDIKITPEQINNILLQLNSSEITNRRSLEDILLRPQVSLKSLKKIVPRGTKLFSYLDSVSDFEIEEILQDVEILIKYQGYIDREKRQADKILKLENIKIPEDFDYSKVLSLSIESRQKLNKYRPTTIAQASRIPGVSPSDISVLLVYFGR